jgi:Cu/Ag efflux protein CusF
MTPTIKTGLAAASATLLLLATASAMAASPQKSLSRAEQVSGSATVQSVDKAGHRVVLVNADGETMALSVAADSRALTTLKPGDKIKATYTRETELVLSPPNKPLPADSQTVVAKRAAETAPAGGVIAHQVVVTGAVLGVDTVNHTLKLASPRGGEVHTIAITRPEGRAALAKLRPGVKITAYVTEAVLITAVPEPAK